MTAVPHNFVQHKYIAVPEEMRLVWHWVNFRLVPKASKPGKFDKVPYNPRTAEKASTTDPATWGSFNEAIEAIALHHFDGIGFTFGDGWCGLDLGSCRDTDSGEIAEWALAFIGNTKSYTEASPSNTGVHVLGKGRVPPTGHKHPYEGGVVEMYDHGRFFTVTGNHIDGTPLTLSDISAPLALIHEAVWSDNWYAEDIGPQPDTNGNFAKPPYGPTGLPDAEVLERCRTDKSGELFVAFYDEANLFDVDDDDSRADWFVWNKLVFYLGNDVERIIALAERSAHYRHPENEVKAKDRQKKWQRPDPIYGTLQRATLAKILASRTADQVFRGGTSLDAGLSVSVLIDKTMAALAAANRSDRTNKPRLYVRGGVPVRVHYDEDERPSVKEIAESGMLVEIDRAIRYTHTSKTLGRYRVSPPKTMVAGLLAETHFPFPALTGITEIPVMRPDGSVLAKPGYDTKTGLLYMPIPGAPEIPPVPEKPTDAQIQAAFDLLHEVISDFPFHSPADRANALALLLTLVMRGVISGNVPLSLIDAPTAGTGKGLLVEVLTLIAIGHISTFITEATSDADWGKRLTTALMTGRTFYVIDNVELPLRSSDLASLLTAPEWGNRILATNREFKVSGSARGVWCATGNNIMLDGDMARRCYRVRLDAKISNPFLREAKEFTHPDLKQWVMEERPHILNALLTVCSGWYAKGKPLSTLRLGSFEQWSQTIGGILNLDHTTVGSQFMQNGSELWEQGDIDSEEWEPFIRQLVTDMDGQPFMLSKLASLVRDEVPECVMLRVLLPAELAAWLSSESFGKKLSHAFRKHNGKRYGNEMWRLESAGQDSHTKAALWRATKG